MKKLTHEEINEFLSIVKEPICSADHRDLREGFWDDMGRTSGLTITTTSSPRLLNIK